VVPSTARSFQLIDFIDTPGLTDGNLRYPFKVNEIIEWIAARVDSKLFVSTIVCLFLRLFVF
jgi:hypothetical protein